MKLFQKCQNVKFLLSFVLGVYLLMWCLKFVVFMLFMVFVVLVVWVFWIQGFGNVFYQKQGESCYQCMIELFVMCGKIFDCNGFVFVMSLFVCVIWVIFDVVLDDFDVDKINQFGKFFGMMLKELCVKLLEDKGFVYVKCQVLIDVVDKVVVFDIFGIYQCNEYKCFYLEGEIIVYLIGFMNVEDEGQEGVELGDQKMLFGMLGMCCVIKDWMGYIIEDVVEQILLYNGIDVDLLIDSKIQYIVYVNLKVVVEKFKVKVGVVMVVDVCIGEVFVFVNYLMYNLNDCLCMIGEQLCNWIMIDVFELGLIMKLFMVLFVFDLYCVMLNMFVEMGNGYFVFDGVLIIDDVGFGMLMVGGVIQKLSNIGVMKIVMMMWFEEMWNMYMSIGFGQVLKVGFFGVVVGCLCLWKSWCCIEQVMMLYGYGLLVLLFQFVWVYMVIVYDGELMFVIIFKIDFNQLIVGMQVFNFIIVWEVCVMFEMVVVLGGMLLDVVVLGYCVGGKSGIVYKYEGYGYMCKYCVLFVGMVLMLNLCVVIVVLVDELMVGSYFGGQVFGFVFFVIVGDMMCVLNVLLNMLIKQFVVFDDLLELFVVKGL